MSHELEYAAKVRGIRVVSPRTTAKYGLTVTEWLQLLEAQGWACAVCRRGKGVQLVTDHEHVPGWKGMPAEKRKVYVRGILCAHCNYQVVHSRLSAQEAERIFKYLTRYEVRRAKGLGEWNDIVAATAVSSDEQLGFGSPFTDRPRRDDGAGPPGIRVTLYREDPETGELYRD